jgi:hypothetical protein
VSVQRVSRDWKMPLTNIDAVFVPFHNVDTTTLRIKCFSERSYTRIHDTTPYIVVIGGVTDCAPHDAGEISGCCQFAS